MSFRLPQNLESQFAPKPSLDGLHQEILAEKAASLGRAARILEVSLKAIKDKSADADRGSLLQAAADAAQNYFIQRELCGIFSHERIIEDYEIPRDVIARIGIRERPKDKG